MSIRGGPLSARPGAGTYMGDSWYNTDDGTLSFWNKKTGLWVNLGVANALGTPVNTGGTASIGAILGDPAGSSIVSLLSAEQPNGGTTFVVHKSVTKTAIVGAGVDLTVISTGGAVEVEDVIFQNDGTAVDSTGHASVLQVYSNNVHGAGNFVTDAQAKLGANAVVSGATHTTNNRLVLETGKKISLKAGTEDVTSAGTLDVYLLCRRLADGAALVAA